MRPIVKTLLVSTLIAFTEIALSQEISLEQKEWIWGATYNDSVFMTDGPRSYYADISNYQGGKLSENAPLGHYYRIHFLVYEVYYSILIEEVEFSGNSEAEQKIVNRYFVTGFEIAKNFDGMLALTDLGFVKWDSWNSFVVDENGNLLKFRIKDNGVITAEKLNK